MGLSCVIVISLWLASAVCQQMPPPPPGGGGGGFHGRGGPPPPGPPPPPPPGGQPPCCQAPGMPSNQGSYRGGDSPVTGAPGGYSLSPGTQGSFRGGDNPVTGAPGGYSLSPSAQGSFRGGFNASAYYPSNWTTPSPTTLPTFPPNVTALAPIGLPDGSVLLQNGTVRFPNGTLLLTRYSPGASLPVARLPSGVLMFPNGTVAAPQSVTAFPPPGVPLNATAEASTYPPVYLPTSTAVALNGSLVGIGRPRVDTVFVRGYVQACLGVACHHSVG